MNKEASKGKRSKTFASKRAILLVDASSDPSSAATESSVSVCEAVLEQPTRASESVNNAAKAGLAREGMCLLCSK